MDNAETGADADALQDLYQSLILDHNARPQNFGTLPGATHSADGVNPLCGDQVTVALQVEGERIADVRFAGRGCAISKASASLMTCQLRGKSLAEVEALFGRFHDLLAGNGKADIAALGKLAAFAGVRAFPMRVKCATLAWHTLRAALAKQPSACTE